MIAENTQYAVKKMITIPKSLAMALDQYIADHPEFNFSGFVQKSLKQHLQEVQDHGTPIPTLPSH